MISQLSTLAPSEALPRTTALGRPPPERLTSAGLAPPRAPHQPPVTIMDA